MGTQSRRFRREREEGSPSGSGAANATSATSVEAMYSREMPLSSRYATGRANALTTADAATGGKDRGGFRFFSPKIVRPHPMPYYHQQDAPIAALGAHLRSNTRSQPKLLPLRAKEPDKVIALIGRVAHGPVVKSLTETAPMLLQVQAEMQLGPFGMSANDPEQTVVCLDRHLRLTASPMRRC